MEHDCHGIPTVSARSAFIPYLLARGFKYMYVPDLSNILAILGATDTVTQITSDRANASL